MIMKKLTFILTLMLAFVATAQAAKETYDFTGLGDATGVVPTWGEEVTSGGVTMNMLAKDTETFGNRFAAGPVVRNTTINCFKFRDSGDYKGLYSQYDNRNLSILNLKKGDKVTITMHEKAASLKFVGGDAVESGKEYTVEADGNMDLVSTGGVYISAVVITPVKKSGSQEETDPQEEIPVTGIAELPTAATAASVFTLSGQRVHSAKRGLYIVNGKKIIKK